MTTPTQEETVRIKTGGLTFEADLAVPNDAVGAVVVVYSVAPVPPADAALPVVYSVRLLPAQSVNVMLLLYVVGLVCIIFTKL